LLAVAALECLYHPHFFGRFAAPGIAAIFCAGLAWFNFKLHQQTRAPTPWKNSLVAVTLLVAAMLASAIDLLTI
jgi:hypothetical protein